MALEKCSECGTEVSSTARTCPKCGRNFYGGAFNDRSRTIGIVILVLLVLYFLLQSQRGIRINF